MESPFRVVDEMFRDLTDSVSQYSGGFLQLMGRILLYLLILLWFAYLVSFGRELANAKQSLYVILGTGIQIGVYIFWTIYLIKVVLKGFKRHEPKTPKQTLESLQSQEGVGKFIVGNILTILFVAVWTGVYPNHNFKSQPLKKTQQVIKQIGSMFPQPQVAKGTPTPERFTPLTNGNPTGAKTQTPPTVGRTSAPECVASNFSSQLECEANYTTNDNLGLIDDFCRNNDNAAFFHVDETHRYFNVAEKDAMGSYRNYWLQTILRADCNRVLIHIEKKSNGGVLRTPFMSVKGLEGRVLPVPRGSYAKEQSANGIVRHTKPFRVSSESWRVQYLVDEPRRIFVELER